MINWKGLYRKRSLFMRDAEVTEEDDKGPRAETRTGKSNGTATPVKPEQAMSVPAG
jgi:hypothetical protein